jgi:hypothetical protein
VTALADGVVARLVLSGGEDEKPAIDDAAH